MINDTVYKIRDIRNGQFVEIIAANGHIVNSINGRAFNTWGEAQDFLYRTQNTVIGNLRYINLNKFEIVELRLTVYNTFTVPNHFEANILNKPEEEEHQQWFKSIVTQCVIDGFCEMDQTLLSFALTDDKYHSILVEYVPPHILQCLDEFMSVGISGCDLDLLGSISLTATQKQLKIYDIDGLFASRTEKISK